MVIGKSKLLGLSMPKSIDIFFIKLISHNLLGSVKVIIKGRIAPKFITSAKELKSIIINIIEICFFLLILVILNNL